MSRQCIVLRQFLLRWSLFNNKMSLFWLSRPPPKRRYCVVRWGVNSTQLNGQAAIASCSKAGGVMLLKLGVYRIVVLDYSAEYE